MTQAETMTFYNGGQCESCHYFCFLCSHFRHQHKPVTDECPYSDRQAEEYGVLRFMHNHEGFREDEIEIKCNDQPPHTDHIFTNAFTGGVKVTHIPTGIEVVEPGKTYWEPLTRALIRLREKVGSRE